MVDIKSVLKLKVLGEAHVFNMNQTSQKPDFVRIVKDLGIHLDGTGLIENQNARLFTFLAKYMSELCVTNLHCHNINTGNAVPLSAPPYRQIPQMRAELERQLKEMQKHGIIDESNSVWHSPVVTVKKPNTEWRF